MKFNLRPRPSGEAARAVFKEYDFPMEGGHAMSMDGSDWELGTGSSMNHVAGVHDAQMDFDGNIWITYSHAKKETTIARINGKTGAVKNSSSKIKKASPPAPMASLATNMACLVQHPVERAARPRRAG